MARHAKAVVIIGALLAVGSYLVAALGVGGQSLFDRLELGEPVVAGEALEGRELLRENDPTGSSVQALWEDVDPQSPEFLAGAAALPLLMGAFGVDMRGLILAGIGGALGLILVAVAFDWGLSLITAWAGASAVVFGLQKWMELGDSFVATIIFFALLILGVGWQASRRRKN